MSGIPISFLIYIVDQNQVILTNENTATANLTIADQTDPDDYIFLWDNHAVAQEGIFNFTGFTVVATPGVNFTVGLNINFQDQVTERSYFQTEHEIEV